MLILTGVNALRACDESDRTTELFAQHGLRSTRQRIAVYEVLAKCRQHPTADELHHLVQTDTEPMSLATVYNTLEALCEAGLARKLATVAGSCRYDADMSDHIHVRVQGTDEIHDVPEALGRRFLEQVPTDVLREIESTLGVTIAGVSIQVIGVRQ